jgi:hypothetical protein
MTHRLFLALVLGFLMTSCESGPDYNTLYRMEKPYWDVDDYTNALYKISATAEGSKKPSYGVPETAPVFKRLVNIENVSVIVEDDALGVQHRSDFAEGMFQHGRDMMEEYAVMNREDKFEYPQELVDVMRFNLYTQLHYFELGNMNILREADDPNEQGVKNLISGNEQTLVNNHINYLDFVNDEQAFSADALTGYVGVLNEFFPSLIAKYPNANYTRLREKATDMEAKATSPELKAALANIIAKIDANKAAVEAAKAEKMAADSAAAVK